MHRGVLVGMASSMLHDWLASIALLQHTNAVQLGSGLMCGCSTCHLVEAASSSGTAFLPPAAGPELSSPCSLHHAFSSSSARLLAANKPRLWMLSLHSQLLQPQRGDARQAPVLLLESIGVFLAVPCQLRSGLNIKLVDSCTSSSR